MDPGEARHIAGLVVGTSERTLTSSSSAHGAEQEEKGPTTIATAGPGGGLHALATCRRWGPAVVSLGRQPRSFKAPASGAMRATWEALPMGQRRLLQDLRRDLDMILCLSSCRRSRARAPWHRRRTACRRHSKGRHELE